MLEIKEKNELVEEMVDLIIEQTDLVYSTNVNNKEMEALKNNISDIIICNMSEFIEKEIDKFKENLINTINIH